MGGHLFHIGDQIGVAEHHAARRAEAARGEQDDARGRRLDGGADAPGEERGGQDGNPIQGADRPTDILKVGDFATLFEGVDDIVQLALFDEAMRGEHPFDAGETDGRAEISKSGGEVQHGRDAAVGVQGEEGHHGARAGRQQNSDPFAARGDGGQLVTQGEAGANEIGVT